MTAEQRLAAYKALSTDRETNLRDLHAILVEALSFLEAGRAMDATNRVIDALDHIENCAIGEDVTPQYRERITLPQTNSTYDPPA